MEIHEMVNFLGIPMKCVKIHKICDFCVTGTHESAKSTKHYELPLQIGVFLSPEPLILWNSAFSLKSNFSTQSAFRAEKYF